MDTTATEDTVTLTAAQVADLEFLIERLEESAVDAQLAAEDRGWMSLTEFDGTEIDRSKIRDVAKLARVMAIHDPLIRRAVNLRIAYVWGSGVTISAANPDEGGQDVNAVVQAFLDDQAVTFSGAQACEERERSLHTDGNVYLCLPTDPLHGRVQVRTIPDAQVVDVVTDPEDAETPWLYKRSWTQTGVQPARDRATGALTSITTRRTVTAWYPALGYRPASKVRTLDGHRIEWDKPVLHVRVNRPAGSKWGTPDLTAALPWAQGYRDFLLDWAKLVKALSRFAFRATAKNRAGATQVRDKIEASPAGAVGGTVITPEGHTFEAIGKTGATIDSGSGKPLAAMVSSATDVPVTMLTGDPGVTGARATAETLDKPFELVVRMRRDLNASVIEAVLNHVIDSAIEAPRGPLRGTARVDPVTGIKHFDLAAGQDRGVDIDWPSLDDVDVKTIVEAIVKADGTGYLPEETIARMLLVALDVDNVDAVIESLTNEDGTFRIPGDERAARSALAAVGAGRFPDQE